MSLTAIIPAAGVGTRLRPHTHSLPKALLPVAGRPVLAHILDQLIAVGVDRVVLVLGYLGDEITTWLRASYPELRIDSIEQAERLGLGHAIFTALEGAELREGPGLVILGDTIVRADFAGLLAAPGHAMGVKEVADPRRFGVAVTEGNRIVDLEEKPEEPRSNLAMVGLYNFRDLGILHESLDLMIREDRRTRGEYQVTDALQWMIDKGEHLSPFAIDGWYDVGKEETWLETNRELMIDRAPTPREGVVFHPPVCIPDSAILDGVEIGPYVSLGESVEIRGGSIENSVVGAGTSMQQCRIQNSLIGARCRLDRVIGSINVGEDCSISAASDNSPPQR